MAVKVKEWRGAWWIFINYRGKRKAKSVGSGKAGHRAALAAAEQIQAKLVLGDSSLLDTPRVKVLTLGQYAEAWHKGYVELCLKPGTAEQYAKVLRVHWLPELGEVGLAALIREHVKMVLSRKLSSGLKPNTAKLLLSVLRACLNAAMEDGLIAANPAARVGRFMPRSGEASPLSVFTPDELIALLEAAERQSPQVYARVLTLARTGLRIGEGLALQVDDLDLLHRELWVRRTWGGGKKTRGDRRFNVPKSGKPRHVDMSQQLCYVLRGYLAMRGTASPWLFPTADGSQMTPGSFWQCPWHSLLRRAVVPYRKPHALRHTYASLLIQHGESLAYVRDQLGHHSIALTVDTYGHLPPGANKAAVDRLDKVTGRNLDATRGLKQSPATDGGPAPAEARRR
jgi:integrase